MYSGMTCYEEKDRDWWIARFFVVKDLNALLTVIFVSLTLCYINYNIIIVFKTGISASR